MDKAQKCSYEDLKKLASKGDLILVLGDTALLLPTGWDADRDAWFLGASKTFHFASTDENRRPAEEQRANAALVKHRYNNFDKVLETLQHVLRYFCETDNSARDAVSNAYALLAEIAEVRVADHMVDIIEKPNAGSHRQEEAGQ
jgi:hypothetical protein